MSEQEQDQFENDDLENEANEQDEHRDDDNPETEQKAESEEFEIVVEGEEPTKPEDDPYRGQPAPEWVKELRVRDKENQKRIKELESELSIHRKQPEIELGEKPTLASAGYDEDEFDRQLSEWHSNKAKFEQQEQAKKTEQEKIAQHWQQRVENYNSKKAETKKKVRDFDEAEEIARDTLSPIQQNMIIAGADNPELLIYHLGKYPQKAKELAGITDPVQFAFKAGKIDAQLKVQARKPSTSPERKISGSGTYSTTDKRLQELEQDADRTGDRTKLVAYKKSLNK